MKRVIIIMVSALAWAGIVLAGCTDIEPAASEIEKGQQYTLCIKASKGKPATKTLLFENDQLRSYWANGDVLKVYDATTESHIVDLVSQEEGEVTEFKVALTEAQAGQLAAATGLKLVYKSPNYTAQTGTMKSVSDNCDYAIAMVSIASVNNNEYKITTDKADFVSQQAIVQFKIENELGTPIDVASLKVTYGNGAGESFTVNVDESIKVTNEKKEDKYPFVAIPGCSSVGLEAVGRDGRTYNFSKGVEVKASNDLLQNGYFYPIAVQMHGQPMLGDPYYSDCTWATCNKHANGAQVVGIVVYLGGGAVTEEAAGYGHGLVMALKDAAKEAKWGSAKSCLSSVDEMVPEAVKVGAEKALVNFGGYDKTNQANNKFEAAYAAKSYNVTVDKEKCSGWFLPASGQWLAVVYGLCGAAYPDKAQGTWWRNGKDGTDNKVHLWGEDGFTDKAKVLGANSDYAHEIINAKLQAAAGLNASAGFDPIETGSGPNKWVNYWTSSECVKTEKNGKTNTDSAIRMNFGVNEKKETKYSSIKTDNKIKDNKDSKFRVRAFLAF